MSVKIRRFKEEDIPYKVKWINDSQNNRYLHYDLPLREDKTFVWFQSIKDRTDRLDYTITYNDQPAGLIGLLNIDYTNSKAEYYISLGGNEFKGKGIATIASDLLMKEAFTTYNLNKVYLYTEVGNLAGQHLFDRIGFLQEGLLKQDLIQDDEKVDRYVYGLVAEDYLKRER